MLRTQLWQLITCCVGGKQSEGRTFSGSLVMLTDKRSLAQLRYLRITSRGHRVLGLQVHCFQRVHTGLLHGLCLFHTNGTDLALLNEQH